VTSSGVITLKSSIPTTAYANQQKIMTTAVVESAMSDSASAPSSSLSAGRW